MSDAKRTCPNCIDLRRQVKQLRSRIAQLEEQLGTNSSNSSKPPSSDSPFEPKPKEKQTPTGRKQGAQKGHPGKARTLLPPEQVTHLESVYPSHCPRCAGRLSKEDVTNAGTPRRHQILEIPKVKLDVIEYQLFDCRCPKCGEKSAASLPCGVPLAAMGPRLQALTALLSGRHHMSTRDIQDFFLHFLDASICLGSIPNANQRTNEALQAVYEEALAAVRSAKVINADETGWKERNQRAYLWVAAAMQKKIAVFHIDPRRNREAWHRFIGTEYKGFLGTDRHGAYSRHEITLHQFCWAHLKRDFKKLVDRGGPSEKIGDALMVIKDRVFESWHLFRGGSIDREELCDQIASIGEAMQRTLRTGMACPHEKTAAFCKRLLEREFDGLWVFSWADGVEPTNNSAERAVRPAVLKRKNSFGTQSATGSRFVERILTVVQSLRLQGRSVYQFLVEACAASLTDRPPPSLVT